MEGVNLKKNDRDELVSMKKWLQTLSEEELLEAMSFSFDRDGSGKSHEYDLLVQMLSLQSPPPTPIHPRAMGVKLASSEFANDGKNELQRVLKNRIVCPRLFQFIERESGSFDIDQSLVSLPPQIASMMRKENKAKLGRRRIDHHYQVIARKFVTQCGEILSLGSTTEMKDADEQILMGSCIQSGCRLVDVGERDQRTIWCTFRKWREFKDSEDCNAQIMRMLHVTSRGRSFTCPPKNTKEICFASWFDPTREWFSLPAYLASRFEVALWNYFRKSKRDIVSSSSRARRTLVEETFSRLPPRYLEKCLATALARALRKAFLEAPIQGKTRDLFLYQYILNAVGEKVAFGFNSNSYKTLSSIPMVLLQTPFDRFRLLVIEQCEFYISRQAEDELVKNSSLNTKKVNLPDAKSKNKNKKRKKRRKKKRLNGLGSINEKKADNDTSDEQEKKNSIIVSGGKCRVTNQPSQQDESNDGFLETVQKSGKKTKPQEKKYVLKKTKKPPKPSKMRPIAKPRSRDDVNLSPAYLQNQLFDNQMTMKRSNLTNSHSIWNATLQDAISTNNLHSSRPETSVMNFAPSHSTKYQKDLSLIFTPIWVPNHSSDLASNVGLPINADDDFLNEMKPYDGLFSHFFNDSTGNHDANFASSTVASIASSVLDNDSSTVASIDNDGSSSLEATSDEVQGDFKKINTPRNNLEEEAISLIEGNEFAKDNSGEEVGDSPPKSGDRLQFPTACAQVDSSPADETNQSPPKSDSEVGDETFPEAPKCPPAQVSPILLSLADLGEMRRRATFHNIDDIILEGSAPGDSQPKSLASLPVPKRSFSREDLRISYTKDDEHIRRRGPLCSSRTVDFSALSYRNAALKNATRARSVSSHDFTEGAKLFRPQMRRASNMKSFPREIKLVIIDGSINLDVCAQSESALDDHEDSSHWNVIPKIGVDENDNATATRDGATTISSIPAPHEMDELVYMREERDSYRDTCLTMAAEISKLKNMLALERINANYSTPQTSTPFGSEYMPSFYHNRQQGSFQRYVAMSDAGLNEVPMSEDGTDVLQASVTTADKGRRHISRTSSLSGTNRIQATTVGKTGGSDIASLEYDNTTYSVAPTIPNYKYSGPNHLHQSRLSQEIDYFLTSVTAKIQKEEKRRSVAIKRLTTLVKTIWPRAQVLMYGSHQTDLRLPTSDVDFVICLPNVHKKAPADAPGALEGRNAVNESNQKLLARKLKSESWIGKVSPLDSPFSNPRSNHLLYLFRTTIDKNH
jgi:hypothetical protein